jgi:hypothetical protein
MSSAVWKEAVPEKIEEGEGVGIERLPGGFEDKGLEVHRIKLEKDSKKGFPDITSFHSLVAIEGKAEAVVNGRIYVIPQAKPGGNMLMIPAATLNYSIRSETKAEIIDTFTPA